MMLAKRKRVTPTLPPKKRKKSTSTIAEISFDLSAREDYLTGFHKRKLQRTKRAQEEAKVREREEKIVARKTVSFTSRGISPSALGTQKTGPTIEFGVFQTGCGSGIKRLITDTYCCSCVRDGKQT